MIFHLAKNDSDNKHSYLLDSLPYLMYSSSAYEVGGEAGQAWFLMD